MILSNFTDTFGTINSSIHALKKKQTEKLIKLQLSRIQYYKTHKKNTYNSIIPLNIYQTWHSKNLPENMKKSVENLKRKNPRFQHFLFDDNDCRNFIEQNFDKSVLDAYDKLIPGAYKADLWRYCILYKNGGIYLDIKYDCVNSFRFIELTEKEHWVFDINGNDIYNALICALPGNQTLLNCIHQIVKNVNNNYYGNTCVDPTGPGLVGKFIDNNQRKQIQLQHIWNTPTNDKFILYNNIAILKMYKDYYHEQHIHKKVTHYSDLWNNRNIYRLH